MWFSKGTKVKYLVYHTKKTSCGYNLQNKSCTNNHNYCRKHQKFIKLSRNHPIQNCQKFSPIVDKIDIFSNAMAIVIHISVNCSYNKVSKAAIDRSCFYCEGRYNKVLQTQASSFQMHTLMFTCVINLIESITQNKNQIDYWQNKITTKTQHNGSFFLHKK